MMRERLVFWLKVSTVPVAAGLWYLVYRAYRPAREIPDEGYHEEKRTRSDFRVVHVRVPKRAVGAVIGKSGQVIQKLQQSTGTRINFGNRDNVDSNDEELLIRGLGKAVEEAEREVRKIIASVPAIECEELRLPARYIGPLIGRGGDNIRAIMERTRAKIDINRGGGNGDQERLVTIRGSRAQIDDVTEAIATLRCKVDAKDERAQELQCEPEKLPPGDEPLEVLVSVVKNPVALFLQLSGRSVALEPLIRRMTEFFEQRGPPQRSFVFRPGDLVAAIYEPDGTWHRARVVDVTPEVVDIDYVDYGDCAELSPDMVRPLLEPSFCSLPIQAIEVRLHGLQFSGSDAEKDRASSYLEEITYRSKGVPLHAIVVSREGDLPSVRLTDPNKNNAEINAAMIAAGFCTSVNT